MEVEEGSSSEHGTCCKEGCSEGEEATTWHDDKWAEAGITIGWLWGNKGDYR